jgi:catechol 2,3-dioxygenase-like lactoylglutathione lyase family enzyme
MPPTAPLVTPLKRTAIIVTDMERSLRFYRDVLGLGVWVEGRLGRDVPAIFRLLGLPPGMVRWVILQSADVDWGMVGLFELRRPAPPKVAAAGRSARQGEACLVFHTLDVEAVHRGARAMKLPVICPPTLLEIAERGVLSKEMTLRAGVKALSNRFPGLRKPRAARRRPAALSRRRSGASSRDRSE